jgi:hypothetical protein
MSRHCPQPAPGPLSKFPNCPVQFTRMCADGSGIIIERIPGAYLFADSQALADEYALALARGRALNQVLYCNTITESDLSGCGLIEVRPGSIIACTQTYCNESGIPYCNEDSINYERTF